MKFSPYKLNLLLSSRYNDTDSRKTLRSVASEIGISAGYLALLRNGSKTNPGPRTISKLSRYFNVAPEAFFESEPIPTSSSHASLKITVELCDDLISTDRADKALDVLNQLIVSQSQELREANLYNSAVLLRAVAVSRQGDSEDGLRMLDEFLHQGSLEISAQSLAFYERSRVQYGIGYYERAIEDAKRALDLIQGYEDAESQVELMRKCNYVLGTYYARVCRFALSILHYDRARTLVKDIKDRDTANIFLGLGNTYLLMNEPKIAEQHLLSARKIYEEHHDSQSTANVYHNLSRCYFLQENYTKASELLHRALEMHQQIQTMKGVAYDYMELARNAFKTGDYETAKELATRSSMTFREIRDEGQAARARLLYFESLLHSEGDLKPITDELVTIIQDFTARKWVKELGKSRRLYATLLEMNGQLEESIQIYKEIIADYESYLDETFFTD